MSHNEFKSATAKTWTHLSAPKKARINSAQHMQSPTGTQLTQLIFLGLQAKRVWIAESKEQLRG
jgi:hypothetical protein